MGTGLADSIAAFADGIRVRRLFYEDENVVGNAWFSKRCQDPGHVFANLLRLFVFIFFAPFTIFPPKAASAVYNVLFSAWDTEAAIVPETIISKTPRGEMGRYAQTGYRPQFMLKVAVRNGVLVNFHQIPWSEEIRRVGYTAISYPMRSAYVLFEEAGGVLTEKPENREYGLADRKAISKEILVKYATTKGLATPNFDEYIWLDEFCLSDDNTQIPDHQREGERRKEVGRLADIFRGAEQVCVFCDAFGCDHTSTNCLWGTRIFTLAEILHANKVIRMTRTPTQRGIHYDLIPEPAHAFRGAMQAQAAIARRWHLYAIMQHSVNSGAVPWQVAIHSLIVEAIRRDEAGNFIDHTYLGKALNGLLPRRACVDDLQGNDGWADLAWLLELNQGFYNAAALAATCSLGDYPTSNYGWLGRPLEPMEGNERLEPIATAFPVDVEAPKKKTQQPALCVIGAKAIGLRHKIRRDPAGLWNNEELGALKTLLYWAFWILLALFSFVTTQSPRAGLALIILDTITFSIFRLLAGTAYVKRDGWVFVYDAEWRGSPQLKLGEQDRYLRDPTCWGHRQMAPLWHPPGAGRRWAKGTLIDLKFGVYTSVIVTDKPNSMATLAIHGCGITCMLLNRPDDAFQLAQKVGMVNMPSYILAASFPARAVYVA